MGGPITSGAALGERSGGGRAGVGTVGVGTERARRAPQGRGTPRVELDGLVRTGGRALAASRIALGVSALVSPRLAATPWVGWSSTDPAGTVLGRAAGARDIALGAGALLAVRQGARAERTWVALAAFCDVADAATTVAHWRRLPSPGRLLVSAAAAGAAVVGIAAATVPGRQGS